jgi:hypothetical protein
MQRAHVEGLFEHIEAIRYSSDAYESSHCLARPSGVPAFVPIQFDMQVKCRSIFQIIW